LQMEWDSALHRHLVLPVKRRRACQEVLGEQGPRIHVALEKRRKRSMFRFHEQLHDVLIESQRP
jgi:hypothetical protein